MLTYREATDADLPAICRLGAAVNALHHEAWPEIFAGPMDPMLQASHWQRSIAGADGKGDATSFVCEDDEQAGEMLGFVTVFIATDLGPLVKPTPYARVGSISVADGQWGRGIGTALMQRAEDWGRARGVGDLRLHVWRFNERAMRLYAELGYEVRSSVLGKRLSPPAQGGT